MDPVASGVSRRALNVVLVGGMAVALVGFFVGVRPVTPPPSREVRPPAEARQDVIRSRPSWELRQRRAGPNSLVTSDLQVFRAALPGVREAVVQEAGDKQEALASRAHRRAYDGAPPVVPHAVDEQDSGSCLACHEHGARVGTRVAPAISHAAYTTCTQCHALSVSRLGTPPDLGSNGFSGLAAATAGTRAWAGAPPTVPHPTSMRSECLSCHGPSGRQGMRTPHPYRQSCTQCHVPAAEAQPWHQGG